jgi:serine/tyrosine/threonine adenylyltransferase
MNTIRPRYTAQWNLARFAETLLPLLDADPQRALGRATEVITAFPAGHAGHWLALMRRKLGLLGEQAGDLQLVQSLLELMHANRTDYTNSFRALNEAAADAGAATRMRALFGDGEAFDVWAAAWRSRLDSEKDPGPQRARSMREANPAYIPRNHRVEQAIRAAVDRADFAPFNALLEVLERPFDERPDYAAYALPPGPGERVLQTFCGT